MQNKGISSFGPDQLRKLVEYKVLTQSEMDEELKNRQELLQRQ